LQDASLWPDRVRCSQGFLLDGGDEIAPGGDFDLIAITGDGVQLYSPEMKTSLQADLAQTDAVARARRLVLIPSEQRPSRVAAALSKGMVAAHGAPYRNEALDQTRVFALYYGASWCAPCRQFSPGFVKFINRVAAENPRLTVVLMSNDKNDADMLGYMKEERMPWPAVPLATLSQSPLLLSFVHGAIPQLAIVDRHGKLLADAYDRGRYVGPQHAVDALDKLLKSGSAR
jgi:thiol-disulfide isomerase/thioredoxin